MPAKVLLIAREGSAAMEFVLTEEVAVMVRMLQEAGFTVQVASVSGQPIVGTATTLKPDLKLADVKVEDYAGFIVPCMAAGQLQVSIAEPPEAIEVVKKAAALGKPIAAAQAAMLIVYKAGALPGKQFAIRSEFLSSVTGGTYKGEGVVQDGNLVTAGSCPNTARTGGPADTTEALAQQFITLLATAR